MHVKVDLRDDLEDEEAEIAEHEEVAHFGSSVGHVCHEVCVVVAAVEGSDCPVCAVDAAKNCQVPEHFLATWQFPLNLRKFPLLNHLLEEFYIIFGLNEYISI